MVKLAATVDVGEPKVTPTWDNPAPPTSCFSGGTKVPLLGTPCIKEPPPPQAL
ncbi:MAG: hypothetical protein IPM82_21810 [Saprospiraceae bacterium]|nr:hypothetical protein [Saprospiraceae bacterium]